MHAMEAVRSKGVWSEVGVVEVDVEDVGAVGEEEDGLLGA